MEITIIPEIRPTFQLTCLPFLPVSLRIPEGQWGIWMIGFHFSPLSSDGIPRLEVFWVGPALHWVLVLGYMLRGIYT